MSEFTEMLNMRDRKIKELSKEIEELRQELDAANAGYEFVCTLCAEKLKQFDEHFWAPNNDERKFRLLYPELYL